MHKNQPKRFKVFNGNLYTETRDWINKDIALKDATAEDKADSSNWSEPYFGDSLAYITFKINDGSYQPVSDDFDNIKLDTVYITNLNSGFWIPMDRNEILTFKVVNGYVKKRQTEQC